MFKKRKRLKLIGLLGLGLFIGGLGCSANAFAVERHAVYLERNYADQQGVMHHLTEQGHIMAEKEFTNSTDPYTDYQIIDAFNDKQTSVAKLNEAFKNSKDEDINYLVIESHGWDGGIIDFSFKELKEILDKYKGHFVINIFACNSGGAIDKMQKSLMKVFQASQNKMGEFKDSKYNVFCSSSKTQSSYYYNAYAPFTKAYFNASKIGTNGFLNADYNRDNIVTPSELSQYLQIYGLLGDATPVFQVVDAELPVFATNRSAFTSISTFDFNGIGTWSGEDTHFAQLKYNGDYTATLKEGIEMYGSSVHPYFETVYASVLAKDKEGNVLFIKEFKGTDWVQTKEESFPLPEGATLTIYHAEGTSERFTTSNNHELKQQTGTIYNYSIQNKKLVQITNSPYFKLLGLGDWEFAKLSVNKNNLNILTNQTSQGAHCYFGNQVYASVLVQDQNKKEVFKKEFIGNQHTITISNDVELKEGYTVTIHHEEPQRLKTSNDANLHKEEGKDFHYIFTNGNLIEQ
ncbi:putative mucin/carbohydrate-binding domain-containing protein [Enterococcus hirae]|uniref:putative mucin/carbohydrate-binding domain-containing protein n=1 Tax=Enterococcus hirae TaxID=1354 RepID=UPI001A95AAA2|nr:putative mucin/carbohydrate-binding domain-containing protein [Enterococcus hirae]MBO1103292.1 hypothetical protein [Enterococcus hirae]